MPRADARRTCTQFADEWDHRGVRAWHEGWWEIGPRDRQPARADPRRAARHDHDAPERDGRAVDRRVVLFVRRAAAARSCCRTSTFRPTTICSRASAATAPRSSTCRPTIRFARRSIGWSRRSTSGRRWCRCRWCCSGARACRTCGRSSSARIGSARTSCSTSTRPPAPCRWTSAALGVDFAVGGSVKWLCGGPGAGYLYVRPDLIGELRPSIVGWAGHASPFELRDRRRSATRPASSASRAARRTCRRWHSARAGYEIVGRDRRAGDSRAIAAADAAADRRARDARGWRLNTPDDDDERGGIGRHRRAGRRRGDRRAAATRRSSSTTARTPASAWRRTSTRPRPRSIARIETIERRSSRRDGRHDA